MFIIVGNTCPHNISLSYSNLDNGTVPNRKISILDLRIAISRQAQGLAEDRHAYKIAFLFFYYR